MAPSLTRSATDAKVVCRLIRKLKRVYHFKKGTFFIADAAYDEREIYNFIVNQLKCRAFIPINPRNQQEPKTFGPHGCPICEAGLEMASAGAWTENLRDRAKFRCAIKGKYSVNTVREAGLAGINPALPGRVGHAYGVVNFMLAPQNAGPTVFVRCNGVY